MYLSNRESFLSFLLVLATLVLQPHYTCTQKPPNIGKFDFRSKEQRLKLYADSMNLSYDLAVRKAAKAQFDTALISVLCLPGAFDYPFDSLSNVISILKDSLYPMRIFSWQLKKRDHIEYGGCIQLPDSLIVLHSKPDYTLGAVHGIRRPHNWLGALYYDIVPVDVGPRGSSYILLGSQRPNPFERQKLIEILRIDQKNGVRFGAPVFVKGAFDNNPTDRFLLRYSSDAQATIHYDTLYKMIIFDHLIPVGKNPAGETKWVPDGSYSAYVISFGQLSYISKVFHLESKEPPMSPERKNRKEKLDIFGKPMKEYKKKIK